MTGFDRKKLINYVLSTQYSYRPFIYFPFQNMIYVLVYNVRSYIPKITENEQGDK